MTTMTDHTMKAFDTDLQDLARMVAEMGGLAEKQVADSADALAKRDSAMAQRVSLADANIDALQREIEERAVLTIARRQPMAVDLRDIVGALRLANDLERPEAGRLPSAIEDGVVHARPLYQRLRDDTQLSPTVGRRADRRGRMHHSRTRLHDPTQEGCGTKTCPADPRV